MTELSAHAAQLEKDIIDGGDYNLYELKDEGKITPNEFSRLRGRQNDERLNDLADVAAHSVQLIGELRDRIITLEKKTLNFEQLEGLVLKLSEQVEMLNRKFGNERDSSIV